MTSSSRNEEKQYTWYVRILPEHSVFSGRTCGWSRHWTGWRWWRYSSSIQSSAKSSTSSLNIQSIQPRALSPTSRYIALSHLPYHQLHNTQLSVICCIITNNTQSSALSLKSQYTVPVVCCIINLRIHKINHLPYHQPHNTEYSNICHVISLSSHLSYHQPHKAEN